MKPKINVYYIIILLLIVLAAICGHLRLCRKFSGNPVDHPYGSHDSHGDGPRATQSRFSGAQ
jgi:hypothetical protein